MTYYSNALICSLFFYVDIFFLIFFDFFFFFFDVDIDVDIDVDVDGIT